MFRVFTCNVSLSLFLTSYLMKDVAGLMGSAAYPFNAWFLLKNYHTYLNKPAAFIYKVWLSMYDFLVDISR